MRNKHFGLIDLQEAYQLIGLVKVDFDNTYPHQVDTMWAFFDKFIDHPKSNVARVTGARTLTVTLPDVKEVREYRFHSSRVECVTALAILINLSLETTVDGIEYVIKNIFSDQTFRRKIIPFGG